MKIYRKIFASTPEQLQRMTGEWEQEKARQNAEYRKRQQNQLPQDPFDPGSYRTEWKMITDLVDKFRQHTMSGNTMLALLNQHLSPSSAWREYLTTPEQFANAIMTTKMSLGSLSGAITVDSFKLTG